MHSKNSALLPFHISNQHPLCCENQENGTKGKGVVMPLEMLVCIPIKTYYNIVARKNERCKE
ncbi:hypothetical protein YC2023_123468 [Brassica napus]